MFNKKDIRFSTDIAIKTMSEKANHFCIEDKFVRTLKFINFKDSDSKIGFYQKLQAAGIECKIIVSLVPYSDRFSKQIIRNSKQDIYEKKNTIKKKNRIMPAELTRKAEETERLEEDLDQGETKLYAVKMKVTLSADSLRELNSITRNVKNIARDYNLILAENLYKQQNGWLETQGIMCDRDPACDESVTMETLTLLAPTLVSTARNYNYILGYSLLGDCKITYGFDSSELENNNEAVFAMSGSGKTYLVRLLIMYKLLNGRACIIFDPKETPDYTSFVLKYGGKVCRLGVKDDWSLNMMKKEYKEIVVRLIQEYAPTLETNLLKECFSNCVENKENATFSDLADELIKHGGIKDARTKLHEFVHPDGVLTGKFDQPDTLNFNCPLISFEFGKMPDGVKSAFMTVLAAKIKDVIFEDNSIPRQLIIDEAQSLLGTGGLIADLLAKARSAGGGVTYISQQFTALFEELKQITRNTVNENIREQGLANIAKFFIGKQAQGVNSQIFKEMGLTDKQLARITNLDKGEFYSISAFGTDHFKTYSMSFNFDRNNKNTEQTQLFYDFYNQ